MRTVLLDPQVLAQARQIQALIATKRLELQALELGLEQFIRRATGVDVVRQQWTLDLDHGQLTKARRSPNG